MFQSLTLMAELFCNTRDKVLERNGGEVGIPRSVREKSEVKVPLARTCLSSGRKKQCKPGSPGCQIGLPNLEVGNKNL